MTESGRKFCALGIFLHSQVGGKSYIASHVDFKLPLFWATVDLFYSTLERNHPPYCIVPHVVVVARGLF